MHKIFALIICTFLLLVSCNQTLFNHKDYEIKLSDLSWHRKIEGYPGTIYLKGSNLIYGQNLNSTFIEISSENGNILNTLHPYKIEKERKHLILDDSREFKSGYSLINIPVDSQSYSKITLKVYERQYRGDTETFYLIVNLVTGKDITILFNREQFTFISDITHFKDGKFVITFNGEAENSQHKYFDHVGLFDLNEIIEKEKFKKISTVTE